MDRTEPEEIAEVSSYAVLGFPRLKLTILEVKFKDSTYLTVDKNYWAANGYGVNLEVEIGLS